MQTQTEYDVKFLQPKGDGRLILIGSAKEQIISRERNASYEHAG
jgi:hypothetical protein